MFSPAPAISYITDVKKYFKSKDLFEILQEILVNLIDFRIFIFSSRFFLKAAKLEQFLMSSGRRYQVHAALCWKEDPPSSVLSLRISTFEDFMLFVLLLRIQKYPDTC